MQKDTTKVYSDVLKKITPTKDEQKKFASLAKMLEQKVAAACKRRNIDATVRVEGSVAKDTWISEKPDIDVFMQLSTSIPRDSLGEVSLEIAREATAGSQQQIERFAEHPYLEAFVDDVRVNVVPCYVVKRGEWLSATDRTPFHTDYIKKHLDAELRGEVRLLKRFMQGIGVYGAEIKIGGFSGYLCELLILHYKSLTETLKAFAQCTQRITIDIESYYMNRPKEPQLLFAEPLVVVDPVDKGRNVASAVQPQKLHMLIAAARAFLKTPSTAFFYPPLIKAYPAQVLKQKLENRGSAHVFLTCAAGEAVPDVIWGQLYRTQRSLRKLAELNDFKVLRDVVWSDEKTLHIFILEFEQRVLSKVKKHFGPPLAKEAECDNFLAKYSRGNDSVVSGPYIEAGRWVVVLQRRCTDAVELLEEKLRNGGRDIGVAELVSGALKEKFAVLVDAEISEVYRGNSGFAAFLTDFLEGKPFWLTNTRAPSKS